MPAREATAPDPTVSVVIPVKDDAPALARCLRVLALQTRPADEVVVVDNGCADDSAAVARNAGARVIRCDEPGIPAAASRGYDAATGEIILRLDADCLPARTWVQAMANAFANNPEVAAFTGGARFTDGPRALRRSLAALYLGAYAAVLTPTLGHLPLFGSNLGMRRRAWRGIRHLVHRGDADVHDDLDLAYHLGEQHRIAYLPESGMGISMRPFFDARGFARRVGRGVRTVFAHWPEDFPPVRINKRMIRAVLRRAARVPARSGATAGTRGTA